MAIPNGGLITETNQQYYAGAQGFTVTDIAGQSNFTFTFNTNLILGDPNPANTDYALNNFKLYSSSDGINYIEYVLAYTLDRNVISLASLTKQWEYWSACCKRRKKVGGREV